MSADETIDKSDNGRCSMCKFYFITDPRNLQQGECRRLPLQYFLQPTQQGIMSMCGFPVTRGMNWCGEFQAKISLVS